MDAAIEPLVARFLTRGGKVFVVPQYSIPSDNPNQEWACPDFVALDFGKREIVVVEVSTGANPSLIGGKVQDRQKQWYGRLRAKLVEDRVADETWRMRYLGFVRRANLDTLRRKFSGADDVAFHAIEDATFDYLYWSDRAESGLPR
jgi:hypothetical protein